MTIMVIFLYNLNIFVWIQHYYYCLDNTGFFVCLFVSCFFLFFFLGFFCMGSKMGQATLLIVCSNVAFLSRENTIKDSLSSFTRFVLGYKSLSVC